MIYVKMIKRKIKKNYLTIKCNKNKVKNTLKSKLKIK